MSPEDDGGMSQKADGNWLLNALLYLGLGSVGPTIAYNYFTGRDDLHEFSGWQKLLLPFGAWMLTGMLLTGVATVWHGGLMRRVDWEVRATIVWVFWCKFGMWCVGIALLITATILGFSWLSDSLSGVSKGTQLVAGLLFLILLALWRFGVSAINLNDGNVRSSPAVRPPARVPWRTFTRTAGSAQSGRAGRAGRRWPRGTHGRPPRLAQFRQRLP